QSRRVSAFTRRYWATPGRASVLIDARAAAGLQQRLRNALSNPFLEASKENQKASSHAQTKLLGKGETESFAPFQKRHGSFQNAKGCCRNGRHRRGREAGHFKGLGSR